MTGLEILAAVASAAGTAVSAFGAIQQGRQQAATADFNARVAEVNARQERQAAQAESDRSRREAALRRGRASADTGASGVARESFLDVLTDDAIESELEALNIRVQGERRARGQEAEAQAFRLEGKGARRAGVTSALTVGLRGLTGLASRAAGGS